MGKNIFSKIGLWVLLAVIAAFSAGCPKPNVKEDLHADQQNKCDICVRKILPTGSVIGQGNTTVLILAGIGGDEPAALKLSRELRSYLENRQIKGRRVIFLDPQEEDIRQAFTQDGGHSSANAIMDFIQCCRPQSIISLRQLSLDGIDPDGPKNAYRISWRMSEATYPNTTIRDLPTSPGSIGKFGEMNGIPVINIALSDRRAGNSGEDLWYRFGNALLAGISYPRAPEYIPIDALRKKGIEYLENADFENAIRIFKEILARDPNQPEASESLFQAHIEAGRKANLSNNYAATRYHYQEAMNIRPECRECKEMTRENPLLTSAKDLYQAGKYTLAQNQLESALNANSECEDCRELLEQIRETLKTLQAGLKLLEDSQFEQALAKFNWIREVNPGDPNLVSLLVDAHTGLGEKLFAEGNYEKSGKQFEQALVYNKDCQSCATRYDQSLDADTSIKNGRLLLEKGDYEEAIQNFSSVLRLNPKDPSAKEYLVSAHRDLGEKLCGENRWIDGISHFQTALETDPDCGECQNQLNNCIQLFNTHQYQKAKDFVFDQRTTEAYNELIRVPPGIRTREVRELIERLEPLL